MRGTALGEEILRPVATYLGMVAEVIAVVIIAAAVLTAAWGTLRGALSRSDPHPWSDVRLNLARSVALALEFMLAADVVRTAVAPSWDDIGRLAAVAVIRTGLNFFLHRDLQEGQERPRKREGAVPGCSRREQ